MLHTAQSYDQAKDFVKPQFNICQYRRSDLHNHTKYFSLFLLIKTLVIKGILFGAQKYSKQSSVDYIIKSMNTDIDF